MPKHLNSGAKTPGLINAPPLSARDLETAIAGFMPITLQEMESVQLMDRLDTKFVFRRELLSGLMERMKDQYRILAFNGVRGTYYETLYYDTESLDLYAWHHSGRGTRFKMRSRRYVGTDLCFFEIKAKTNKGRTVKRRVRTDAICEVVAGTAEELLRDATPFAGHELKPSLWVTFTRFTFVGKEVPERLTIDVDLAFRHAARHAEFSNLVIAELKQDQSAQASPFLEFMRSLKIRSGSMSKYCLGVATLCPGVKINRFKERIRHLQELAA